MTDQNKWKVNLYTLFPEMFPGSLEHSIAGKALDKKIWQYEVINIRDYAKDKHKTVDDAAYGGGTGMVIRPDVLGDALDENLKNNSKIIYMSPRGKVLTQKLANELANEKEISIICGRFEGIDERIIENYNIEEISIGDYILSGGELAAKVLMDTCIRLLPGVISKKEALEEESFGNNANYSGLLEYPLYTRPFKWKNFEVPEVLMSGNHEAVRKWRLKKAIEKTKNNRPDLWEKYDS